MPAPKRRIRKATEFDPIVLRTILSPPATSQYSYAWSIDDIIAARDDQLRGGFQRPVALARKLRTDAALFAAYRYRISPQDALGVDVDPSPVECVLGEHTPQSVADEAVAQFGDEGAAFADGCLNDIHGCLANHGLAIGKIDHVPREDGSRVDLVLRYWPLEFVRFDPITQSLITRTKEGMSEVPIVHGDGRWIVFRKFAHEPWAQDAALVPAALVWASHAYALQDWGRGSLAHGNARAIGELPEGVSLTDAEGALTAEAAAFLGLLRSMLSSTEPVGVRPAGSKTEFMANPSGAWQVWKELADNSEKAAARIYLGTDGILGAAGGAPGIDIQALFGVATTILQSDLRCISRCLASGLIDVWAAINFGSSAIAPSRVYQIPDADAQSIQEGFAARNAALFADLKAAKEGSCLVDQPYVDTLASKHGVPSPLLAVAAPTGAGFFAYELDGGVFTIDEVRMSKGIGPISNGTGSMTIPQVRALPIGSFPAPTTNTVDPDGDGEPGEPPTDESAANLAAKMTEQQVANCEHGSKNRCRLCGVERVRDFDKNAETGEVVWKIAWRPIGATAPATAPAPAPASEPAPTE